jgi:hypothetical protein
MNNKVKTDLRNVPMTSEELTLLSEVAARLDRLLDASHKFVASSVDTPLANSPMALAYQADLRDPYQEAFLLLFAAEDHLRTILMALRTGPVPGFSLYTLLRAAGEADVRCRHLLDRNLTETERLGRGLNERLDNIEESRKVDTDSQSNQYYDGRIANLEHRAVANGITPIRKTPTAPITAFGEPRKKIFDLFSLYLQAGSTAFRFLSGYTHSMMWVVLRRRKEALPSSDPRVGYLPTDLEVPLFASVLSTVLDLHDENCGHWLRQAGYPFEVWQTARKGAAST